jgi:hypothetical protein
MAVVVVLTPDRLSVEFRDGLARHIEKSLHTRLNVVREHRRGDPPAMAFPVVVELMGNLEECKQLAVHNLELALKGAYRMLSAYEVDKVRGSSGHRHRLRRRKGMTLASRQGRYWGDEAPTGIRVVNPRNTPYEIDYKKLGMSPAAGDPVLLLMLRRRGQWMGPACWVVMMSSV